MCIRDRLQSFLSRANLVHFIVSHRSSFHLVVVSWRFLTSSLLSLLRSGIFAFKQDPVQQHFIFLILYFYYVFLLPYSTFCQFFSTSLCCIYNVKFFPFCDSGEQSADSITMFAASLPIWDDGNTLVWLLRVNYEYELIQSYKNRLLNYINNCISILIIIIKITMVWTHEKNGIAVSYTHLDVYKRQPLTLSY